MHIGMKDGTVHKYEGSTGVRKMFVRSLCQTAKRPYLYGYARNSVVGVYFSDSEILSVCRHYSSINGRSTAKYNMLIDGTKRRGTLAGFKAAMKAFAEPPLSYVATKKPEPKIRVFDGTLANPFDLKPSDMKPMVMIHSISTQNRFTGHAAYPYSIGQHSRNLAMLVPAHLKRAALIHDFSEAFFNDLASPVKRVNPAYKEAEHEATIRIFNHFGVTSAEYTELGQWDKAIYVNERDALFAGKIGERGQGDQYTALDTSRLPLAFNETDWRDIRDGLILLWLTLFPDFDLFTGEKRD